MPSIEGRNAPSSILTQLAVSKTSMLEFTFREIEEEVGKIAAALGNGGVPPSLESVRSGLHMMACVKKTETNDEEGETVRMKWEKDWEECCPSCSRIKNRSEGCIIKDPSLEKAYFSQKEDLFLELTTSPEILQGRSEAIIKLIEKMIEQGLDPQKIIELENTMPNQHRDFLMTLLGIKPYASDINEVFKCYGKYIHQSLNSLQTDLDIKIVRRSSRKNDVWNLPLLIQKAKFLNKKQLLAFSSTDDLELNQIELGLRKSFKESYERLMFSIKNRDEFEIVKSMDDFLVKAEEINLGVEAIMFGYPYIAGHSFEKYHVSMVEEAKNLWASAERENIQVSSTCPTIPTDFIGQCQQDFVTLAKNFGTVSIGLLEYVEGMRSADVSGYQYITTGDSTVEEEELITSVYLSSGLDKMLRVLLDLKQLPLGI